ncbi:MAG: hypothetical protein MRY79_08130 [Alphaproteobacteria bacterium]|nr:hypothetical protein [Alphaproteobacteria bacterium]
MSVLQPSKITYAVQEGAFCDILGTDRYMMEECKNLAKIFADIAKSVNNQSSCIKAAFSKDSSDGIYEITLELTAPIGMEAESIVFHANEALSKAHYDAARFKIKPENGAVPGGIAIDTSEQRFDNLDHAAPAFKAA